MEKVKINCVFHTKKYLNNIDTVIISNEKDKRKIIHSIEELKEFNNSNFYKQLDTRGKFIVNNKRDGYTSLYFGMNFIVKEGYFYKLSKELKRLIDHMVYISKNHKPFDGRYWNTVCFSLNLIHHEYHV